MSFIIGNKCVGVCDTSCVFVCPVDCINGPIKKDGRGDEVENMTDEEKKGLQLYINPEECIDCGACIPECPVDAIYRDCLLYTSPSPRDRTRSRMPSSA